MRYIKNKLSRQLITLIGIIFAIVFICFGIVLPKVLISVAEKSIYTYLSEPLKFIETDVDNNLLNTKVAYLYLIDGKIVMSDNFNELKGLNKPKYILKKLNKNYGKFRYKNQRYYYYKIINDNGVKIAISDDTYINETKSQILSAIFPIVLGTCLLIGLMLVAWSSIIVRKIEKLN